MPIRIVFSGIGALIGFVIGFATRPTFLGFKLPLEALFWGSRDGRPLQMMLIQHLGGWTIAGAIIGLALSFLIAYLPAINASMPVARPTTPPQPQSELEPKYSSAASAKPTTQPASENTKAAAGQTPWDKLIADDPDVGRAAHKLGAYGDTYVKQFAHDYMALNDKSYLNLIVDKIEQDAKRQQQPPQVTTEEQSALPPTASRANETVETTGVFWNVHWRRLNDGRYSAELEGQNRTFPNEEEFRKAVAQTVQKNI
ncbi:UNVERIFIED_ORG: hypothetical protein BCL66_105254 [Martelella mediterranea]